MIRVVLFASALLLSACTAGERMASLKEGMSPAQVTAVMGGPTGQQRAGDLLRYDYANGLISGWGWDRADFYAVFQDEKLIQWGTGEVRQNRPPTNTLMILQPFPPVR